ncbi:MAG TPA: 4Fe-4S single cluster domain-containing protein [Anaerolineaceae bacterium]|nr:4Fe-4S single cluster domain-containing protein [Anaerolineaceae bacterium]
MNSEHGPTALRVHRFLPGSYANGPGYRAVLWLQGCTLGCPGCFNPETHTAQAGEWIDVEALVEQIILLQNRIEGLTISGGEPLQQIDGLTSLLESLRERTHLSTLVFTGFAWDEVNRMPRGERLLRSIDVLIAGRFKAEQRLARGLRGSNNKTVHFLTERYSAADLERIPDGEIVIQPDGSMDLSGIDPLHWPGEGNGNHSK